jgi:nicotinamide-nucleotide amidase
MTDLAGSSAIFDRGFVTYSNQSKQDMLDVSSLTLERYGAVSEQVVIEMVEGAIKYSRADIALSISGVAGPGGGTDEKPIGMVCFGWMTREGNTLVETANFSGDRDSVRRQAVDFALEGILTLINGSN